MADLHGPGWARLLPPPETETYLYGAPDAEHLWFSLEEAVEHEAALGATGEVTIEQFDVYPPTRHLPGAAAILEWIAEWAAEYGEVGEDWSEATAPAFADPLVREHAESLRRMIGARISYRMARRRVNTHTVTIPDGD